MISRRLQVRDSSHVAEVRRAAVSEAASAGLDNNRANDVGIGATELATNLIKHGGGGSIVISSGSGGSVELLSIDGGPGFADVARAMRDGYSTAGSPGNGLGAISRLANVMEVYSQERQGSVLYARFTADSARSAGQTGSIPGRGGFETASICVAVHGENVPGDGFAFSQGPSGYFLVLIDGSGHGQLAAEAAHAGLQSFRNRRDDSVAGIVQDIHSALRPTRGAAVAVAHVHTHQQVVRYCGVGNIAGAILAPGRTRRMVSHNGIAGAASPKIAEFTYPWEAGSMLVMHSDGIGTKWDIAQYPGLIARHPAVVAGVLFRDFVRDRDDATVVVAREVPA